MRFGCSKTVNSFAQASPQEKPFEVRGHLWPYSLEVAEIGQWRIMRLLEGKDSSSGCGFLRDSLKALVPDVDKRKAVTPWGGLK